MIVTEAADVNDAHYWRLKFLHDFSAVVNYIFAVSVTTRILTK